jgi:hypothetical protein
MTPVTCGSGVFSVRARGKVLDHARECSEGLPDIHRTVITFTSRVIVNPSLDMWSGQHFQLSRGRQTPCFHQVSASQLNLPLNMVPLYHVPCAVEIMYFKDTFMSRLFMLRIFCLCPSFIYSRRSEWVPRKALPKLQDVPTILAL